MAVGKVLGCELAATFRPSQFPLMQQMKELANDCHLYIISRRPRTYIKDARLTRRGTLKGKIVTLEEAESSTRFRLRLHFPVQLAWNSERPWIYYTISDPVTGEPVLHGDTWGLSLLASGFREDLTHHEVLYIGQSRGEDGSRNALHRLMRHETYQRIMSDHEHQDYDIFINLLRVTDAATVVTLSGPGSFEAFDRMGPTGYALRATRTNEERIQEQTDLCEAALIGYFQPTHYNEKDVKFPNRKTKKTDQLEDEGYTSLRIALHGSDTGIQFWSPSRPPRRMHTFEYRLKFADSSPEISEDVDEYIEQQEELNLRLQAAAAASPRLLSIIPAPSNWPSTGPPKTSKPEDDSRNKHA